MSKISLALLAGASVLCFADQAQAIDASPAAEPTVIYAGEPAQGAPVRVASAQNSNMGGGFIQFLLGDAPRGGRYQQQQPMYQQQPESGYARRSMDPQQSMRQPQQEELVDERQRPFDPK